MKQAIILYNLIVILICLIFNSLAIFEESAEFKFLLLSEILLTIGLYYGIKTALNPKMHKGNFFFFIFNIFQSITVAVLGLIYKISYGPQMYIKLHNNNDWFLESEFNFYSRILYFSTTPPDDFFYLGINVIQLYFAFYFYKELKNNFGYLLPKFDTEKEKS